jgi:hypothetical protein
MKQFIKKITRIGLVTVGLLGALSLPVLSPGLAYAGTNIDQAQKGVTEIGGNQAGNRGGAFTNLLESIINLLLFIIGAIAVIMIIIGGIRYTTSNGDASQTKGAKDTILYAIVGLVVAIMAYSIVNFVLDAL